MGEYAPSLHTSAGRASARGACPISKASPPAGLGTWNVLALCSARLMAALQQVRGGSEGVKGPLVGPGTQQSKYYLL